MSETFNTHQQWQNKTRTAYLDGGKVYYGVVNGDPVNVMGDRINIFANRALTSALPNPISIGLDGRTAVNGIPAKVWLAERHSIFVLDNKNVEQFQDLDKGETPGTGTPITLSNVQGTNAITAESSPTITGYVDGQIYIFKKAGGANTATTAPWVTLQITGASQGAKPIKFNFNEEIKPGMFQDKQEIQVMYNSNGAPTTDHFAWVNSGRGISILTNVLGDGNTITADGGPSITGYVDGQHYQFKPNTTNTGAATLKVGTLPTHSIKSRGAEIFPGQLVANKTVEVIYNSTGTEFEFVMNDSKITLRTVQTTTSGTVKDFTAIPAGVKRIDVIFDNVSLDGTNDLKVLLGDSGGFETTGYISTSMFFESAVAGAPSAATNSFIIRRQGAGNDLSGIMTLERVDDAHAWVASYTLIASNTAIVAGGGSKTLSSELTQIRVDANGDNFDVGKLNIQYQA